MSVVDRDLEYTIWLSFIKVLDVLDVKLAAPRGFTHKDNLQGCVIQVSNSVQRWLAIGLV